MMSRRGTRLSQDEQQQLKALVANGMNIKQIARIMVRAPETVRKAARELKLDVRRRITVTDEMRQQIIDLASSGMEDAEGARRVGVAESTFRGERLGAGIVRRPKEKGIPAAEPYCAQLTGLRRQMITGAWI